MFKDIQLKLHFFPLHILRANTEFLQVMKTIQTFVLLLNTKSHMQNCRKLQKYGTQKIYITVINLSANLTLHMSNLYIVQFNLHQSLFRTIRAIS